MTTCDHCEKPLTGRQKRWCSERCRRQGTRLQRGQPATLDPEEGHSTVIPGYVFAGAELVIVRQIDALAAAIALLEAAKPTVPVLRELRAHRVSLAKLIESINWPDAPSESQAKWAGRKLARARWS